MLKRVVAISLALLIGVGALIPLATQDAEAGPRKHRKHRRQKRHYKKYSKKWWRQYHKRMKRKRALQARKRSLRLRQLRLERQAALDKQSGTESSSAKSGKQTVAAALPAGDPAPRGWKTTKAAPAGLQFRVNNSSGDQVGSAAITVVGPAMTPGVSNNKVVGGVSTASLRREVIDRMIKENGWVVNDYQQEIAGQPVYVVVAQSQSRTGGVQSRMFYFTEMDGRIYSVATNSPVQETERLAEESEKVINSLKSRVRPTQRAAVN
jgi:hypothetical protein